MATYVLDLGIDSSLSPETGFAGYPLQFVFGKVEPGEFLTPAWLFGLKWYDELAFRLWDITQTAPEMPALEIEIVSMTVFLATISDANEGASPLPSLKNPTCWTAAELYDFSPPAEWQTFPKPNAGWIVGKKDSPFGQSFELERHELSKEHQRFSLSFKIQVLIDPKGAQLFRTYNLDPEVYVGPDAPDLYGDD